jgi:hypothetical protein
MGKAFGVIGIVLAVLGFLAVMVYVSSWSVRGWVAVAQWDGKSTLECFGSTVMSVRGRTVDMTGTTSAIINPAGNCEMEIVDCNFSGPMVLDGGGNARVIVRNSKLNGGLDVAGDVQLDLYGSTVKVTAPARAEVSGNARVAFHDSRLEGTLERSGNAVVTGIPEIERQAALEDLSRRYGAQACDGVIDCYQKTGAFGNISGLLVVEIDAAGRARSARYENGAAPPVVRECLVALGRARTIEAFDGKPGRMSCYYAGSFIPGAMRMSMTPSFVHTLDD